MQKRGFFGVTRRVDFIYRLELLFYSSVAAPSILFLIGINKYYRSTSYTLPMVSLPDWFIGLLLVACLALSLTGIVLYKRRIGEAKEQVMLRWKVQRFLRAISYKYTLAAFGGTLSALFFYLTNQEVFALLVMTILTFFIIDRPTAKKTVKVLRFKQAEKALFESEESWK